MGLDFICDLSKRCHLRECTFLSLVVDRISWSVFCKNCFLRCNSCIFFVSLSNLSLKLLSYSAFDSVWSSAHCTLLLFLFPLCAYFPFIIVYFEYTYLSMYLIFFHHRFLVRYNMCCIQCVRMCIIRWTCLHILNSFRWLVITGAYCAHAMYKFIMLQNQTKTICFFFHSIFVEIQVKWKHFYVLLSSLSCPTLDIISFFLSFLF